MKELNISKNLISDILAIIDHMKEEIISKELSLLDKMGGKKVLELVVDTYLKKVNKDPNLSKIFNFKYKIFFLEKHFKGINLA